MNLLPLIETGLYPGGWWILTFCDNLLLWGSLESYRLVLQNSAAMIECQEFTEAFFFN